MFIDDFNQLVQKQVLAMLKAKEEYDLAVSKGKLIKRGTLEPHSMHYINGEYVVETDIEFKTRIGLLANDLERKRLHLDLIERTRDFYLQNREI